MPKKTLGTNNNKEKHINLLERIRKKERLKHQIKMNRDEEKVMPFPADNSVKKKEK